MENTMRGKIVGLMGAGLLGIFGFAHGSTAASQLEPETIESFDHYIQSRESRIDQAVASENTFLWIDGLAHPRRAQANERLKEGRVIVDRSETGDSADGIHIPGGLMHDWIGIIFIPNVSLIQTLALVQDYDHAAQNYAPGVERSTLLSRSGDNFRVFLRLKRTEVLTTVLTRNTTSAT
jgi:hypothetical protein